MLRRRLFTSSLKHEIPSGRSRAVTANKCTKKRDERSFQVKYTLC